MPNTNPTPIERATQGGWAARVTVADGRSPQHPAATLTDARWALQETGVIPVECEDGDALVILSPTFEQQLLEDGWFVVGGPNGRVVVELP